MGSRRVVTKLILEDGAITKMVSAGWDMVGCPLLKEVHHIHMESGVVIDIFAVSISWTSGDI